MSFLIIVYIVLLYKINKENILHKNVLIFQFQRPDNEYSVGEYSEIVTTNKLPLSRLLRGYG